METRIPPRSFVSQMLIWASLVIVMAGMRAAAPLIVPLLLALFLAILCGPPLAWLIRHGIRQSLAMVLVLGGLSFVVLILAQVLAATAGSFISEWPTKYLPAAEQIVEQWSQWIDKRTSEWLPEDSPSDLGTSEAASDLQVPATDAAEPDVTPAVPSLGEPLTADLTSTAGAPPSDTDDLIPTSEPAFPPQPPGSLLHDLDPNPPVHDHGVQWHDWIKPGFVMQSFTVGVRALSGILSQAVLILITTIFLLIEATMLPQKLHAISKNAPARLEKLRQIAHEVNHYMAIKTATSLLTGGVVALSLWLLDVDFAPLWGISAFLLNFVPNIGSIIAAVPAIVLTLLQHDLVTAMVVTSVYVAINMFVGYYLEPKWMGQGLGLSTLVVFFSLVFWGWVLGPVGMVLSVPLTMAVKIALEGDPQTRWLAVLMGPGGEDMTDS